MINFETINNIAVPKGENRLAAEQWLTANGLAIPDMPARCLHGTNW
jgi:hypothetical protein